MRVIPTLPLVLVLVVGPVFAQTEQFFDKAALSVQVNGKTESVDTILRFTETAFEVRTKKTHQAIKSYPYTEIKSLEYSYAKSPRWKTAIFVSPLFLFTSGKKHWLLTQGPDDFAMLRLDKENYKLVLAALESKTGKKIEIVKDDK